MPDEYDQTTDTRPWLCWACGKKIEGPMWHHLILIERHKNAYGQTGGNLSVSLCIDCQRAVKDVILAIQDKADTSVVPS